MNYEEIEQLIRKANYYYYTLNSPIMTDHDYDELIRALKEGKPDSPVLDEIGASPIEGTVKHVRKMYSLNNAFNIDDINRFLSRVGNDSLFVGSLKLDGASVELVYDNRRLVRASTRGDGLFGDDCLEKIKKIVPNFIADDGLIQVTGEVIIRKDIFEKFKDEFSSPRNLASGSLMTKDDPDILVNRGVEFFAYDAFGINKDRYHSILQKLEKFGFQVVPWVLIEPDQIEELYSLFMEYSEEEKLPADGMVLRLNSIEMSEHLGYSNKAPRFAIAYKFPDERVTVRVKNIRWDISKNGILTPVAEIESVFISGANISNVTLHNYQMLKRHRIVPGSEIEVVRSGGVIPKFVRLVRNPGEPIIPEKCPYCGNDLKSDGVRLICDAGFQCLPQLKDYIVNFLKKLDFKGLSDKSIEKLIKAGVLKHVSDLFKLEPNHFELILGYSSMHAEDVVMALSKLKKVSLDKLLYACNLQGIGKVGATTIAKLFTLDELLNGSKQLYVEKLSSSFGPNQSLVIFESLYFNFRNLYQKLRSVGFEVKQSEINEDGLKFAITGTLSLGRKEMVKIIEEKGHLFHSSVKTNTDYLIVGEDPGNNKIKKAEKYSIKTISESEFWEIIQ